MVASWLQLLHGDAAGGHLHICSTGDWTGRTFPVHQVDAATQYVAHLDAAGREGIYTRITTLRAPLEAEHRGSAADSLALPALWADMDIAGPGHQHTPCPTDCARAHKHKMPLPPDEQAVRAIVATSGLPDPTLWIFSGGGYYPIWLLDKPHFIGDDLQDIADLATGWQRAIEHASAQLGYAYGAGVGDLARVLRIPGTTNRKAGLERPCRIIAATPARYELADLELALITALTPLTPEKPKKPATAQSPKQSTSGLPGLSPGDDYAQRTDWADILTPHGWTLAYQRDDIRYWTRPGKTWGVSATTNALGTDRLHVFTTSTELEGDTSYSKLGAYAELEHGGDHKAAAQALAAAGYGQRAQPADTATQQAELLRDLLGPNNPSPPAVAAVDQHTPKPARVWIAELDVSNAAVVADWLRDNAGRGKLAGLFSRGGIVVHTPREDEDGYQPITSGEGDQDGPAQVRPIGDSALASRISYSYGCFRLVKQGEDWVPKQALFPRPAARTALDVPDMLPHLRSLRGVVHSPICRPDGTLITAPGYDQTTGLLHLPELGLTVPTVPDRPTPNQVNAAVALVHEMIAGFPFVNDHYRANYWGALLTPLLRALCPPPYKMLAIEAHQPGSGKTLLANTIRWIHGGIFRSELPEDDAELRKQITAILGITTGPAVVLDNVSGTLRSSTLAGLLTSATWDDRPLGSTTWTRAANDRIWIITGNNLQIGGDLPRRTIRTLIDPDMPHPERRTHAIEDLETWTRERRGELLAALLTIIRHWVAGGMSLPEATASDGYSKWARTVAGILAHAEIPGQFDHPSVQIETGVDDDEWSTFLAAIHKAYSDRPWTVKELLADVDTGDLINPGRIPADALPGELEMRLHRPGAKPADIAKSLGRWLTNRDGRWADGFAVRLAGVEGHNKVKFWRVVTRVDGVDS